MALVRNGMQRVFARSDIVANLPFQRPTIGLKSTQLVTNKSSFSNLLFSFGLFDRPGERAVPRVEAGIRKL